eukprot:TRINITY_DN8252_c0_g1_i3.p1 TRINITY_DN8252_c0_g1~~TRINITY_DN8252_c0_g1_i3.p1  ORF type:complete len:183 (-),score=18.03 TRINITY_DN8252_c0_g1_i3:787-1335(-)
MATKVEQRRGKYALTDVLVTSGGMEYSAHSCPRQYGEELRSIFPGEDVASMLIVPTCQHACVDLVHLGEAVEKEKDHLLEEFVGWARPICERLTSEFGHFADYLDPCSGLPMIHRDTTTVYSEVEGLATLLGYVSANAGCCKVILHPRWGSAVYPATMFTKAPLETFLRVVADQEQKGKPAP